MIRLLELTGERIIPELMKPTNGMLLEHIARYYFALPYTKGRVLDIACGVGYGAFMTAKARKKQVSEIVAVDIDHDTIEYANNTYNHQKINYVLGNVLDKTLPKKLGQFDTIISFETIEHIPDERPFMDNLFKMLKPSGTLIISTPFGQGKGKPTNEPFHYHQFTREEFIALFKAYSSVEFYYQQGLAFEYSSDRSLPRDNVNYPIGIAVCRK